MELTSFLFGLLRPGECDHRKKTPSIRRNISRNREWATALLNQENEFTTGTVQQQR